ncbi:MAG: hypothetical protein CME26_13250 [Gemmatimonadetes bacterium]|nr:hypothetical protein [Gemmatimonadota bacterium]|tara:strand:- start:1136 stop:2227 length:1092 start_codon:yes stop_codon:yes gene_type:complete
MKIGVAGARRGRTFRAGIEDGGARVTAVCDVSEEARSAALDHWGDVAGYDDFEEMLDDAALDAVIVATPMHLHAPQAILALERGIHVYSEVSAAVTVEQCQSLVAAANDSSATYWMGENVIYTKHNVLIRTLVQGGYFGTVTYAEGEYLHELKALNERTPWRRKWQTGIRGITYPTHQLGPILSWLENDRIVRVCCEGSGSHFVDPRGEPYHDDTCVMLAKTERGVLLKIRIDMISVRPSVTCAYQLQGTKGVYESGRSPSAPHRIWASGLCEDEETWRDLEEVEESFLPDFWRATTGRSEEGHGGSDYHAVRNFLRVLDGGEAWCPNGIHEAMDMTLPGLISQESIEKDGAWLKVPDSRHWT